MSLLKIDIKKTLKELKTRLCRVPCFLAQRAFWVFVIFFIIEALFGFAIFFYYSFSRGDLSEESVSFFQEKENLERVAQEILNRRAGSALIEKEYFEFFEEPQKVD